MIHCKNLQVTFNKGTVMETKALNGLDFIVPKGQFVSVIGSNGSGKSTMQNVIAGEIPLDEGSVVVNDMDVSNW
ncbi:MAG: ATP-binding cassette domain-containing protein, partial [Sneathiella sp.]|nr:ATP-binding cassette domain-containing protein [Sneathiella sp.]